MKPGFYNTRASKLRQGDATAAVNNSLPGVTKASESKKRPAITKAPDSYAQAVEGQPAVVHKGVTQEQLAVSGDSIILQDKEGKWRHLHVDNPVYAKDTQPVYTDMFDMWFQIYGTAEEDKERALHWYTLGMRSSEQPPALL